MAITDSFAYPTYDTLVSRIQAEITSNTGLSALPNSLIMILARAIAKEISYQYGYLEWIAIQSNPWTATGYFLELWGSVKDITRIAASYSTGTVVFTGTAGTDIPSGTSLMRTDGITFVTTQDGTVGDAIPVQCETMGSTGNTVAGTVLSLVDGLQGINSTVTLATAFDNGTDSETDDALRTRVIAALSVRAVGGSPDDHVNWALKVSGVSMAWCNPVPVQGDDVVVYIMMGQSNGQNGLPSGTDGGSSEETRIPEATGDQLLVAEYIQGYKPVGEKCYVASPTAQPIDITTSGLSSLSAAIKAECQTALVNYLYQQSNPLGSTIYIASLTDIIKNTAGTSAFDITVPAANVTLPVGSVATLGTITWS